MKRNESDEVSGATTEKEEMKRERNLWHADTTRAAPHAHAHVLRYTYMHCKV